MQILDFKIYEEEVSSTVFPWKATKVNCYFLLWYYSKIETLDNLLVNDKGIYAVNFKHYKL